MVKELKLEKNIKSSFSRVSEHMGLLEAEIRANREFIIKQNNQIKFLLEKLSHKMAENGQNQGNFLPDEESSSGNQGVYSNIHSFIHSTDIHSFNNYSTDMHYSCTYAQDDQIPKENILGDDIEMNDGRDDLGGAEVINKIEKGELNQNIDLSNKVLYNYFKAISKVEMSNSQVGLEANLGMENQGELAPKMTVFDLKKREAIMKKPFASFKGFKRELEDLFDKLSKQELLTFLTIYQLEDEIKKVSYVDIARKLNLSEGCIRTYISSLLRKGAPLEKKRYNNKLVILSILTEFRELNLKKQLMALYYRSDPYQPTLNEGF